jgi:hypothetical protein
MPSALPRVLYLATDSDDYQGDSLFHGLRLVLGDRVVDVPRRDPLYVDYPDEWRGGRYGRGFTLYSGSLPEIPIDRTSSRERLNTGEFDLIVIGDIWRCFGQFAEVLPFLDRIPCAVVDGVDSEAPYPYEPRWWFRRTYWTTPRAHRRARYFKRELTPRTTWFRSYLLLPPALARRIGPPRSMHPISFAIPEEKIVDDVPTKTKDFPEHIVDGEVASRIGHSTSYAFADEAAYYEDLRASRFGITTKRGGWDCMRHYELAASGCVLCFRALDEKPASCAPHGLDRTNCVVYRDADDLFAQLQSLDEERVRDLQKRSLAWARASSTRSLAKRFLGALGFSTESSLATPVRSSS